MKKQDSEVLCCCDSGRAADACCGPLLAGLTHATTALALMRSRYAAYVAQNRAYLTRTWHPTTRPVELSLDPGQRWLGLKIVRVEAGGAGDNRGKVEFVARYKIAGRGFRLHEASRFERLDGRWLYVDGDLSD